VSSVYIRVGAIAAFLGVALGAFGAHGLKQALGAERSVWETGVLYHLVHALAILFLGATAQNGPKAGFDIVFNLFVAGIIFFSGSLYVLALTKVMVLGAITPIGGACFLVGWGLLAYNAGKPAVKNSA
jgi:uncharacterized membrane protein YgdD (TMEM256/DUF423 family)